MNGDLAFFGAFNPPTVAHLSLAEHALRVTGGTRVVFVPSQSRYIRDEQGKDFAYDDAQRLAMLEKARLTRPWMTVCSYELGLPTQPRTYETLCHLREGGIVPALLMGSDKLPELEHGWRYVDEIAREFGIVCLVRGSDRVEELLEESAFLRRLKPCIRVIGTPADMKDVSSTAVRQRVAAVRQLQNELALMVPPELLPML